MRWIERTACFASRSPSNQLARARVVRRTKTLLGRWPVAGEAFASPSEF